MLMFLKLKAFLLLAGKIGLLGLATTATIDILRASKIDMKGLFEVTKKVKGFPLHEGHTTVLGITQHGKTFATLETLKNAKEGVFFFNVQESRVPSNFIDMNIDVLPSQLLKALEEGEKVNYIPSGDLDNMSMELEALTNVFYERTQYGKFNIRYAIDEVHLLKMASHKGGLKACQRVATTGLSRGIKGMFLTQRPANIDNTLLTQSTMHIIFALGLNDMSYLKSNGFPVEEIAKRTGQEKYKFVVFNQKEVEGAFMIG